MNLMPYVWIFFAIVFGLYAILLFTNNQKIIPDNFKRHSDNPFYESWRMLAGAGFLVVCAGNILFTMSEYQTVASNYWILRALGIGMWVIGFAIVFFINKKALRLFNPAFYKDYDEYLEQKKRLKEKKIKERETKKALKKKRMDEMKKNKAFMEELE